MKNEEVFECTVTLSQLFDKLNYIDNKMEDHFGSLRTEIASLRYERKDEIEGVKNTLKDMEKSIEAAWDAIKDIQEEVLALMHIFTASIIPQIVSIRIALQSTHLLKIL